MSIISSKAEHVYKSNTLMQERISPEPHASTRTRKSRRQTMNADVERIRESLGGRR